MSNFKVTYNHFSDSDGYGYHITCHVKNPNTPEWCLVKTMTVKCDFSSGFKRNPFLVYIKPQTLTAIKNFVGGNGFSPVRKYSTVSVERQYKLWVNSKPCWLND
jgi:hypothetical protein